MDQQLLEQIRLQWVRYNNCRKIREKNPTDANALDEQIAKRKLKHLIAESLK